MGDSVALGFVCNNRFDEIGKELNDYVKSQENEKFKRDEGYVAFLLATLCEWTLTLGRAKICFIGNNVHNK